MGSVEQFFIQEDDKEYYIPMECRVCGKIGGTGSLFLFSPSQLETMDILKNCQLNELMEEKCHCFICEICWKMIDNCSQNVILLNCTPIFVETTAKTKCLLCKSPRTHKRIRITESDMEYVVLTRMKKQFSVESDICICVACDEVLSDLVDIRKLLLSTISANSRRKNPTECLDQYIYLTEEDTTKADLHCLSQNLTTNYKIPKELPEETKSATIISHNTLKGINENVSHSLIKSQFSIPSTYGYTDNIDSFFKDRTLLTNLVGDNLYVQRALEIKIKGSKDETKVETLKLHDTNSKKENLIPQIDFVDPLLFMPRALFDNFDVDHNNNGVSFEKNTPSTSNIPLTNRNIESNIDNQPSTSRIPAVNNEDGPLLLQQSQDFHETVCKDLASRAKSINDP